MEIDDEELKRKRYDAMIEDMSKNVVEIKPGRKYERIGEHSRIKYRHNLRRNS